MAISKFIQILKRFRSMELARDSMKNSLYSMLFARIFLLYGGLFLLILDQIFGKSSVTRPMIVGYAVVSSGFAFNLFSILVAPILTFPLFLPLQLIFDAAAASSWIYLSSFQDTVPALIYLVQILFGALVLYKRGAYIAAAVSAIGFGVVTYLQPEWNLLHWSLYSSLFLILGLVGGYLSEELFRANENLKEKERRVEKLVALQERILKEMPTGLLALDRDLNVNFVNPAGAHILGREISDVIGRTLSDVEPGLSPFFAKLDVKELSDSKSTAEAVSVARESRGKRLFVHPKANPVMRLQQTVEIGQASERRYIRGDVNDLEAGAGAGLLDEKGRGAHVLLFQDVTQLLLLEDKVKLVEKLAAVGQLAAGIAHEIRNPLASMSASIQMLKNTLPKKQIDPENVRLMEIAVREIDRLNALITEFLDFVKPDQIQMKAVDIRMILGEVVLSIQPTVDPKEGIEFVERYRRVMALGSPEKLKQVVWNLLVNAVQAMKGPGKIEVGCDPFQGAARFWVADPGEGMSTETLSHLFEPFFTTKKKGTGLGLATAYKIIEAHRGEIKVISEVGKGTRFDVFLPLADE